MDPRVKDGNLTKDPRLRTGPLAGVLPGGNRPIYAIYDKPTFQRSAWVANYPDGKPKPLMQTSSRIQYAPPLHLGTPGALLYIRGASLPSQPFGTEHVSVAGDPFCGRAKCGLLRPHSFGKLLCVRERSAGLSSRISQCAIEMVRPFGAPRSARPASLRNIGATCEFRATPPGRGGLEH